MSRIAKFAALSVCFVLNACGPVDSKPLIEPRTLASRESPRMFDRFAERRDAPGLTLRLSGSGLARRDRIVVRATVTNISARRVGWDREFSVHVLWRVADQNGAIIAPYALSRCSIPTPAETQTRFVILDPGQSFSYDIDLSGRFRTSVESHGTYGGTHHHAGIFYEDFVQYHIPDTCKRININLAYSEDHLASGAMIQWFGDIVRELRSNGPVGSSKLALSFQ